MRSRFTNGVLIGGLIGALIGLYYGPQLKRNSPRYLMGQTRRLGRKTGRFVSDVARDVQDFMRRQ